MRPPLLVRCDNAPDGIVDLRSGTVGKSDPRAYCTKITAVGPRGDCPLFLKFLTKIMGGDEELIAYVRRMLGYCLTGDTSEQALFFNHGGGQNGKTTLMSTVSGTSFGDALAANGFVKRHKKTGNGYEGLRIRQDDDLPL